MMPIPNGPTLFVSEYERVVSFHHFPRENEIGSVLLHLRADEGEFIPFAKPYTHVVEERLRAEIYVDGVRAIFHEQMHDLFLSAFWWHLQFLNGPVEFGFGVKVILGRACCGWLAFLGLCRCPEKNHEKHQQEDNLARTIWYTHFHRISLFASAVLVLALRKRTKQHIARLGGSGLLRSEDG